MFRANVDGDDATAMPAAPVSSLERSRHPNTRHERQQHAVAGYGSVHCVARHKPHVVRWQYAQLLHKAARRCSRLLLITACSSCGALIMALYCPGVANQEPGVIAIERAASASPFTWLARTFVVFTATAAPALAPKSMVWHFVLSALSKPLHSVSPR